MSAVPKLCCRCREVPPHPSPDGRDRAVYCESCRAKTRRENDVVHGREYFFRHRAAVTARQYKRFGYAESIVAAVEAQERGRRKRDREAAWLAGPEQVVVPIESPGYLRRKRRPGDPPPAPEHSAFCAECSAVVFMLHFGMLGKTNPRMQWSPPRRQRQAEAVRQRALRSRSSPPA